MMHYVSVTVVVGGTGSFDSEQGVPGLQGTNTVHLQYQTTGHRVITSKEGA
jgi:hypothetical protein